MFVAFQFPFSAILAASVSESHIIVENGTYAGEAEQIKPKIKLKNVSTFIMINRMMNNPVLDLKRQSLHTFCTESSIGKAISN